MSVYQYGNNNPVAFNDPLGNLSKKEIESFGPLKYVGGLSSAFWMKTYASEQEWGYAQDFFERAAAIAGATSIYNPDKAASANNLSFDQLGAFLETVGAHGFNGDGAFKYGYQTGGLVFDAESFYSNYLNPDTIAIVPLITGTKDTLNVGNHKILPIFSKQMISLVRHLMK
ncbi:hypothetical protein GCM10007352_35160 [Mucilaginibacter phyllosphaerae]|nr:hypothetical protein [Mucilaginibacter phyllosphaerae]GGH22077.1 hypothetical protein GCM10007352_35160 [Mucilaginibacter phyllosphaerae]